MTKWREVFGTEPEKPQEFDAQSSPTTVYQRRNIRQETRTDGDGNAVSGWLREEREMSAAEYSQMILMQQVVKENTEGIVTSVTEFKRDEIIDEYTEQLIEEGLI